MRLPAMKAWMIGASFSNADDLCNEMTGWLEHMGLEDQVFVMQILMREALNNAIIHGCEFDSRRLLNVSVEYIGNILQLQVCDDGPGFDWRTSMQNSMPSADREDGRGLLLYRLYAQSVEFNDCGNQVTLRRLVRNGGK